MCFLRRRAALSLKIARTPRSSFRWKSLASRRAGKNDWPWWKFRLYRLRAADGQRARMKLARGKAKTPRLASRGLGRAKPEELEQVPQELREVGDVDGSEARGRTVAVTALVEPIVGAADELEGR